jgi:hypothetical protein
MLHCAPIMHCTLLVPDLLPPGQRDALHYQPRAPRLAALLARGTATELPATGIEAWLCERFGVTRQHDWPVAALTLAADGGDPADGYWLRCDPMHLYFRQNRMHLSSAAGIPSDAESTALIDALNTHFQADGILFRPGAEGRWYLRADAHTELTTHPLQEVIDHAIDSCMPVGADSGHWRRILNEMQMLLHAHSVNSDREARGLPAFNSVWLWGGGRAPHVGAVAWTRLWSNDTLARALAARTTTPVTPLPPNAGAVLNADGDPLVTLTAARDAGGDASAWQNAVEQLEHDWFAPCYIALQQHRLSTLTIVATGIHGSRCFETTARNLWRWWRRTRPLISHD